MKRTRKLLYTIVLALVVMTVAFTVMACGGTTDAKENKYTVTFMNGSVTYQTTEYVEGAAIDKPADPTRTDFVFDGWSLSEGGAVVDVVTTMPAQNIVYYAVFSRRYKLTLDAGSYGTLADENKVLTVKAGENLYSLVADIAPTANTGLEFAAWFQGNNELKKGSKYTMPTADLTINAKYYVGYIVNTYKQQDLNSADYGTPESGTGKGYVGETLKEIPTYDGYRYNSDKEGEHGITTTPLSAVAADNVFNLYYNLRDYSVIYYANLPADVTVEGEMPLDTFAHGIEYTVPDCEFTADGYRFQGWATSPTGSVVYRPVKGNKFSVTKVTSLYAVWVKALTDASGESNDRIYIMKDEDENDIAYLERYSLDKDIAGAYDASTHVFSFAPGTSAALRGIASEGTGKYSYLDKTLSVYKLMNFDGAIDPSKTLTINADGKSAVYKEGDNSFSGTFEYVPEQESLKFTSENKEFFFRLNSMLGANKQPAETVFEIRGEEYGSWKNLLQTGYVDTSYTLLLDGYGRAIVAVYGYNSNMNGYTTTGFNAYYNFTNTENEIEIYIHNSKLNTVRHETCLLIEGEFTTAPDTEGKTETFDRVYMQSFGQTIYAKPAENASVNENGDKIVLDNYSVDNNSAEYYKGGQLALSGKYVYDRYSRILTITAANGDVKQFEISTTEEAEPHTVYEELEEICGQYYIFQLESTFIRYGVYRMRIENNGKASFYFLLPINTDSFYEQIGMEYIPMFTGDYEKVADAYTNSEGKEVPAEYLFKADISTEVWYNIYLSYYYMFNGQGALDVTDFANFKFSFVEDDTLGTVLVCTAVGDGRDNVVINYTDDAGVVASYKLDGYSYVYKMTGGVPSETKETTVRYAYDNIGVDRVALYVGYNGSSAEKIVTFLKASGDDYRQLSAEYNSANAHTNLKLIAFADNSAMLCIRYSNTYHVVSMGSITYTENGEGVKTGGAYHETAGSYSNASFIGLTKEYHDFAFYLKEIGSGTTKVMGFFIDEAAEVITAEGVGTLIISHYDNVATYTATDGTEYKGNCTIRGDIIRIDYANTSSAGVKTLKLAEDRKSFKEVVEIAGYWMDGADGNSYLYVSGEYETEGSEQVYNASYFEYNDETSQWTEKTGTIKKVKLDNDTLDGYEFTFTDAQNEKFIFNTGKSSTTGMPIFGRYIGEVITTQYVYRRSSTGSASAVGILTGGGYNSYMFSYGSANNFVAGDFVKDDEVKGIYFRTKDSAQGTYYYFVEEDLTYTDDEGVTHTEKALFLRDSLYTAPDYGVFGMHKNGETIVNIGTNEDPTNVTAEQLVVTGTFVATLKYVGGELKGRYVAYESGLFMFVVEDGKNENDETLYRGLFWFKMYTSGEANDEHMYVRIMDNEAIGAYKGSDNSVVYFDGYETALYIDANGRIYNARFSQSGNVITVVYVDRTVFYPESLSDPDAHTSFDTRTIYITIDPETHTYTTVSAPSDN